jgi:hypothetical protein
MRSDILFYTRTSSELRAQVEVRRECKDIDVVDCKLDARSSNGRFPK